MKLKFAFIALILTAASLFAAVADQGAAAPDDKFIAGYAAAVLEREFSLRPEGLSVENGHLRYPDRAFGTLEKQQLIKSLSAIAGVKDVDLFPGAVGVVAAPTRKEDPSMTAAATVPVTSQSERPLSVFLSSGRLFEPLLADPRWPHFYASYNDYRISNGVHLGNTASVGFGETIALARAKEYPNGFRLEGGIQAGVFAIFDLDSNSFDLINADYFVGPYMAARYNDFSLLTRVFHQSSHLGDEYLLRPSTDPNSRVNLSYEAIDLLASYELPGGFRVYGGGGWLFDVDPSNLKRWLVEYGAEWRDPNTIFNGSMRPVVAVDLQNHEDNNWSFNYSVRAGVQFEDPNRFSQRMQLMLEFYDGHSPNGQFFDERVLFYGLGLHFYF